MLLFQAEIQTENGLVSCMHHALVRRRNAPTMQAYRVGARMLGVLVVPDSQALT